MKSLRGEYNQTCHNSIRGTDAIAEVNQTPARRVIDLSNTGQDLNTFRGTADAIAPRRDSSILPAFRGTTNSTFLGKSGGAVALVLRMTSTSLAVIGKIPTLAFVAK